MNLLDSDSLHLQSAQNLAEQAIGLTDPNPRVGCVLTSPDGARVLGQGHTQAAGQAHAEVMALRDAQARGHSVHGATAHVTLEPCAHHGRTPPCCEALIAAGVARVVVGLGDPNPLVNGQGIARLRAAGLQVDMGPAALADQVRELNIGFISRMQRGRPWVRVKAAISMDGRTALCNGQSQWITSPEARADGHRWRKRAGAVLTGVGTVRTDNPRLDVRAVPTARQPLRVVLDSYLNLPLDSRLLTEGPAPLLLTAQPDAQRITAVQALGAEVMCLPGPDGRVALQATLDLLGQRGINELHVEAGGVLNAALITGGWVDEWLIYQAPLITGPGLGFADLPVAHSLDQASRWHFHEVCPVGTDLRLRLRPVAPPAPEEDPRLQ